MKVCRKCLSEKASLEFYPRKSAKDGLRSWCKSCEKESVIEYQKTPNGRKVKRAAAYKYARTEHGKKLQGLRLKKHNNKHRKRYRARKLIGMAILKGRLARQPCEKCGNEKAHAHHSDYNKPKMIQWLCHTHHIEWHNNNLPIY
jgi:hypothetical protein